MYHKKHPFLVFCYGQPVNGHLKKLKGLIAKNNDYGSEFCPMFGKQGQTLVKAMACVQNWLNLIDLVD